GLALEAEAAFGDLGLDRVCLRPVNSRVRGAIGTSVGRPTHLKLPLAPGVARGCTFRCTFCRLDGRCDAAGIGGGQRLALDAHGCPDLSHGVEDLGGVHQNTSSSPPSSPTSETSETNI